ncbi:MULTISPECIES: LysR family transcriptional regulator [Pseudooceanicola]|nr:MULTISPECIES: LysR family transcriptional regulator [Pseudooceanicola]
MEVLNAITAAGSMRQAAKLLGVSQPTVSAQLAKLEEAVGAELVHRDRQRLDVLTAAGELWARTARAVLSDLEAGTHRHRELFGQHRYRIRFATMPSHSGRVLGYAAAEARADPTISEFSVSWAPSSSMLMEYLEIRKANMALMAMTSALSEMPAFRSEVLYEDRILWAVPKSVDPALVRGIIDAGTLPTVLPSALSNRVVVDVPHEWRATSDIWFAAHLPGAVPFYVSDLHLGAAEIVAAGLGTCHVSITLHSNLSERIRSQVNFYDIGRTAQQMVLATPRHLMTVPSYADYFSRLTEVLRAHYAQYLMDHPWNQ